MEGAVIGCVPYVQPATKSSSIPECFPENNFIHLPKSLNAPNSAGDGKMLNTVPPEVPNEQDPYPELTIPDAKRLPLKGRSNAMTGKPEFVEKNVAPEEASPKTDSGAEITYGDKISRLSLKRSSSLMLELPPEQTSQCKKPCSEEDDDSSPRLVIELGSSDPGSDSPDRDESKMDLSVVSASTADTAGNDDASPRSLPVGTESPESTEKKRYLFDFRPSTHQIIVKNKSGEKSFKCFVCGGIYQQKFSLKRHYLRNHIDFRYISENDISNCNIPIPYYIKKLHSNVDYKKASNGRKKFQKSQNDIFLDNNKDRLMPGLYRCHECLNVTFDIETDLKEHYQKHPESIKKKFQCGECNASFFKKQILSRHLASHGKRKAKFECKKCSLDFASQGELAAHSESHATGKMCRYCGKSLSTSANRKRHEALHLGLKPHNCTLCGSCFAQSKDLDRHLRKQHSDICRECPHCSKLCATEDNLEVHVKEKHSESPVKKQATPNNLNNNAERENVAKPAPPAKTKSCTVCTRSFHTVYAMLKHKRQAHPYYSRKRKRVKQKVARKEISTNLEFRKAYAKPHKPFNCHPESPAKRGRPVQKTSP